jgi:hypothetical protein
VLLGGLPVEDDVSAGEWIASGRRPAAWGTVAALVPPVFEAYARVLHPAVRYAGDDDVEVPWAEVAALNGTSLHPLAQWVGLTGEWEYLSEDSQPPHWDDAPAEGHLPTQLAARMAAVLARHTGTAESCFFGRWVGFGYDSRAVAERPALRLRGGHDVVLVRGSVADAARNLAPEPHEQSANLWWPADRSWCVVTDIDLTSTYVGGSAACIGELLAAEGVEALPATPGDAVGHDADVLNPRPARR